MCSPGFWLQSLCNVKPQPPSLHFQSSQGSATSQIRRQFAGKSISCFFWRYCGRSLWQLSWRFEHEIERHHYSLKFYQKTKNKTTSTETKYEPIQWNHLLAFYNDRTPISGWFIRFHQESWAARDAWEHKKQSSVITNWYGSCFCTIQLFILFVSTLALFKM